MFTDTVLNTKQKKIAFKALKKIPSETLNPLLIKAALNHYVFPAPLENDKLSTLKNTHKVCGSLPGVGQLIEQAINEYFKLCGYEQFSQLFNATFEEEQWSASFLIYMINELDIELQQEPLVILAIQNGKIYWKYVCGEQLLHDRTARKDPALAFNFDEAKTISMTWEQFREFKDSGKRSGTVAITKERFTLQFARSQHTAAETIWDDLKTMGILDDNNRLSHRWQYASGVITLPHGDMGLGYKKVSDALKSISQDQQYAETISRVHGATLFRPERSPKKWALKGGGVSNDAPKSELHQIRPWDVSIYSDMALHAATGDGLDHDHIPSKSFLKGKQKELKLTLHGTNLERIQNENDGAWGCVAIARAFHKGGLSNSESSATQKKLINKPFFDEVSDYLDKMEMNWQHTLLIDNEYLRALGAFRYLYRSNTSGKNGGVSYLFFNENPRLRQDMDQLVMDRLERFAIKKEGKLTL